MTALYKQVKINYTIVLEDFILDISNLGKLKVIPVVKIDDVNSAIPLADALIEGGLPVAEITFRTACAADVIRLLKNNRQQMIVGAGTVLNAKTAKKALDAGADFIVSPGFDLETALFCKEQGVAYIPGCVTPTEIMAAVNAGIDIIKFFPAETFGGIKAINALAAAFPNVKFMPTGGIDENNLEQYLKSKSVFCCGGSFMVKSNLLQSGNFAEVARLTKLAVDIATNSI